MATPIDTALLAVKKDLLQFCESMAANLDAKQGTISKYFLVGNDTITQEQAGKDAASRSAFLNNTSTHSSTFNQFFNHLTNVLNNLKQSDLETIGRTKTSKETSGEITVTSKETRAAKEFAALFETLNQVGFYNSNGKTINFWSGPEAQEKAKTSPTSLSDSNVPAVSIMIQLGNLLLARANELQTKKDPNAMEAAKPFIQLASMLHSGSSSVFASNAKGKVEVYMSAYNQNEPQAMVAGNFHWNAELIILQELRFQQKLDKIEIHFRDHAKETWKPPIDFNDKRTDHLIHILRRNEYLATDNPKEREQLKDKDSAAYSNVNAAVRNEWLKSGAARTTISLDKLRKVADKWISYKRKEADVTPNVAKSTEEEKVNSDEPPKPTSPTMRR